jgi:hypothetical protein
MWLWCRLVTWEEIHGSAPKLRVAGAVYELAAGYQLADDVPYGRWWKPFCNVLQSTLCPKTVEKCIGISWSGSGRCLYAFFYRISTLRLTVPLLP